MARSPRAVRLAPVEGLRQYAAAFWGFDRNVHLFFGVTAARGMVIAVLGTVFNLYLYSLGFDTRTIGVVSALNSIAVLVTSPIFGYLTDRIGQRSILLVGGALYPLSILALSFATSLPAVMILNVIFGGVSAAYWVAGVPLLVASTSERQRVQVFSINSFLLWGVGPLGALLAGWLVDISGRVLHVSSSTTPALRAGMLFMAVLGVAGFVPYLFLRGPQHVEVRAAEAPHTQRIAALFAQLLIPDALIAFGQGAILTFVQLFFHLRFHLDPGGIGTVIGLGGAIAGVGTLLSPLVSRRWGNLHTAVRLQWTAVPFMIALALAGYVWLAILAYWLILTLRGMIDPVYTAFIQEQAPEGYRARLTGMYSVTYAIGYSLGPAASGELQKASGFSAAFLLGATFYVSGASLLYLFFGRR